VTQLATVRRKVNVPIAADESIRRASDPFLVARHEAADIAVIKVAPLGGVRAALEIIERIGLPAVVSSALETSVGIAAGIALAAALPELPYACGLATVALLERDVVADPFLPVDGYLTVRRPEPHPDLLTAAAAAGHTRDQWQARIRDVEAVR
jgi:O-succinylbenzoate synthase